MVLYTGKIREEVGVELDFQEAYNQVVKFLESINVDKSIIDSTLNLENIQGMIIKKLSSSNMKVEKKNIKEDAEENNKNNHQSHIDFGRQCISFFFPKEEHQIRNKKTEINIKLFSNNTEYLDFLDSATTGEVFKKSGKKYTPIKRKVSDDSNPKFSHTRIHNCTATKHIGHGTKPQVQINIKDKNDKDDQFSMMKEKVFVDDILILFKIDWNSYIGVAIPNIPDTQAYVEYFKFKPNAVNIVLMNESYSDVSKAAKTNEQDGENKNTTVVKSNVEKERKTLEQLKAALEKKGLKGKDVERLVKARVGQGDFRELLTAKYQNGCCICGMKNSRLLRASHIKAWGKSAPQEKVDENNGLLLCANHDALFDKHLISFSDSGEIILSNHLDEEDKELLGINSTTRISVNKEMIKYLEHHRKEFNEKNKA